MQEQVTSSVASRDGWPGRMSSCPNRFLAQIAKDFGVHVGTLDKWMRQARIEAGEQPGQTSSESAEVRELRKRNRLLEQEVEVLRRATAYLSQAHLPGKGSTRS